MKKDEAAVVLALLQGNWAHIELTDQQVAVWVEHLADIPPSSGLATANDCISTRVHFPTVNEFRVTWQAHMRREAFKAQEAPKQLPPVVVPASVPKKWIAEMREMLRKKTA